MKRMTLLGWLIISLFALVDNSTASAARSQAAVTASNGDLVECSWPDGSKILTTRTACDNETLAAVMAATSRCDFITAVRLARPLAAQGDARAESLLGLAYAQGMGVPRSDREAVKWYRKAAEQNWPPAEEALGIAYETGRGIGRDPSEAAEWYQKAADAGMRQAQTNLGWHYAVGQGVAKNVALAAKYLRLAAERGSSEAQHNLAYLLQAGDGIAKDETEALRWYRRAALQGRAQSMNNLGLMYANGGGTPLDLTQAYVWLALAVKTLPPGHEREAATRNLAATAIRASKQQVAEGERQVGLFEAKAEE